jgi:hypothetical protein
MSRFVTLKATRRFDPDQPVTLAVIGLAGLFGVAAASVSAWYLWNSDDSARFRASTHSWQLFVVWIVFVMVIAAYTAAISLPSWFAFRAGRTIRELGLRRAVCAVAILYLPLAVFGMYVPIGLGAHAQPHKSFLFALNLFGALGITAAGAALLSITRRTSDGDLVDTEVVASRQESRRALNILGGAWALSVLAARARQAAIASLAGEQPFPDGLVITYGGILATAIAAIYLPAEHNLDVQARRILRESPNPVDDEQRTKLGLDQTPTERLQRALTLISPLLAAIASLAVN